MFAGSNGLLVRSEIVRIKVRAVRRGVWFRILTRTERACMDLAVVVVERVRSSLLRKVLSSVLEKLEAALESPVQRLVREVGVSLALKLSEIAVKWGYRSAVRWVNDAGFARFLAVSRLNSMRLLRGEESYE
jgi:hypothetical protein